MKPIKAIIILAGPVLLAIFIFAWSINEAEKGTVIINGKKFNVEFARTQKARQYGLSGRTDLQPGQGMLFIWDDFGVRYCWMKGMKFPIDLVWIADSQVVGLEPDLSVSTTTHLLIYPSPVPVNYMLELNKGDIQKYEINNGDEVIIQY